MTTDHDINASAIHRMLKKQTRSRVSKSASIELRDIMEKIGGRISARAKQLAEHRIKPTVVANDVRTAFGQLIEEKVF